MNILMQSDNKYGIHLVALISQIIKYNEHINFYVLDLGINIREKELLKDILSNKDCTISYIEVEEQEFSALPKTIDYISLATYSKLKAAEYLPNIDKILYLDIDITISGKLDELWNIDLKNYAIAACFDSYIEHYTNNYKSLISLSQNQYYFNAGVLLINLKKWRELDVFKRSINWLKNYQDIILYQDQDILNGIFKDDVTYFNSRFNFMPTLRNRIKEKQQLAPLEKTAMPIIISHFCGELKPWHKNSKHFNAYLYERSLQSHFKIFKNLKNLINKIRYRIQYGIY